MLTRIPLSLFEPSLAHTIPSSIISPNKCSLNNQRPEGYVRVFLDEGAVLATLLAQICRSAAERSSDYARKLLSIFEWKNGTNISVPSRDRPLTSRELEILRMIAAGKSYQAIAQELTIALSTVQSHIKNIYQKLDVYSALEAAAQARRLNLMV